MMTGLVGLALVHEARAAAPIETRLAMSVARAIAWAERELDRLLARQGLRDGSVGARLVALRARGTGVYPRSEPGRAAAVADMNAAVARARPVLAPLFPRPLPAAHIRLMPVAEREAGKRGYRDEASYVPDLGDVDARPRWTLTTVAHHETVPGHLLLAAMGTPAVATMPGVSEGWSIYAETLVGRLGLLGALDRIGMLQSLLFRLVRVEAAHGLARGGWSRARAHAAFADRVGFALFFPFDDEVEKAAATPARYAADAAVALALIEGAPRSRDRLLAYHRDVLASGPGSAAARRPLER
jgi:uncharacterized protein (DUF885 family)